jgi:hypothetical protein
MRYIWILILAFTCLLSGCKKDTSPRLSGTDTINNTLSKDPPYFVMGFSFSAAKKISTLKSPLDVFTINAYPGNFDKTYFDCQNYENSFYKVGVYPDAGAAELAFNNLTSFNVTQWEVTGDSVKTNQIWLFKTSNGTYAKFLITGTVGEIRNTRAYVECTFEWVYQPDGSTTFPAK